MTVERQDSRRRFLFRVLGGSAAFVVAGAAGGCVGPARPGAAQGGAGPVEVLPRRDGLRHANVLPATVPPVRSSPAVMATAASGKAFE